jgi:uncharacterized repeat protein (TIGR01451 family)/LPXTG-motif cell wall-anchored protein
MKKYLILIIVFALTLFSFVAFKNYSYKNYAYASTTTTFASGDIVDGKNLTQSETTYHDPVSIKDGETVRVRIRVVNNGTQDAQNVKVNFDLGSPQAVTGSISADNADSVHDAVGLTPGGAKLDLVAGSVMKYGPSCTSGCTVSDGEVDLGTVSPGEAQSYQISIEVKVTGTPVVTTRAAFSSGNIFDGGNRSEPGSTWVDPIPANPGDAVEFRTMVINTGDVTAKDVTVKVTLPGATSLSLVPSVSVSSSNADAVSDTARVNVTGSVPQILAYLPGHTLKYGPGCTNGCSLADGITVHGISIGDVLPGNQNSYQVTFKVYVSNEAGPTPTPTVTPTPTPTTTPTVTPTPTATPTGAPNSCGGTCGSNYNCSGGLFCFNGFCRNPSCQDDSSCNCATPTPTAPPVVLGATAPPVLPKTGFNLWEILGGLGGLGGLGIYFFKKFKLI